MPSLANCASSYWWLGGSSVSSQSHHPLNNWPARYHRWRFSPYRATTLIRACLLFLKGASGRPDLAGVEPRACADPAGQGCKILSASRRDSTTFRQCSVVVLRLQLQDRMELENFLGLSRGAPSAFPRLEQCGAKRIGSSKGPLPMPGDEIRHVAPDLELMAVPGIYPKSCSCLAMDGAY